MHLQKLKKTLLEKQQLWDKMHTIQNKMKNIHDKMHKLHKKYRYVKDLSQLSQFQKYITMYMNQKIKLIQIIMKLKTKIMILNKKQTILINSM